MVFLLYGFLGGKRMEKQMIIDIYHQLQDVDETLKVCNITFTQFYNSISSILDYSYSHISSEQKQEIVNMYLSGMPTTRIGVQMGFYHKLIKQVLNEFNIDTNHRRYSKYTLDIHYFDFIDSANKAYILGLLYADGYNSMDKETLSLSLQEQDMDILEMIRHELQSNKPLVYTQNQGHVAKNGYTSQNMYSLVVHSKHMCQVLNDIGMTQNKSLKLTFPEIVTPDLYSHFIRGYFDGDGSYCIRNDLKYGRRDMITFTSTESFCKSLKEIINTYTQATGGGIYDASCHNGITKVLSFSGRNQTKLILDWLYQDAKLYLQRKYEKYLSA